MAIHKCVLNVLYRFHTKLSTHHIFFSKTNDQFEKSQSQSKLKQYEKIKDRIELNVSIEIK